MDGHFVLQMRKILILPVEQWIIVLTKSNKKYPKKIFDSYDYVFIDKKRRSDISVKRKVRIIDSFDQLNNEIGTWYPSIVINI